MQKEDIDRKKNTQHIMQRIYLMIQCEAPSWEKKE